MRVRRGVVATSAGTLALVLVGGPMMPGPALAAAPSVVVRRGDTLSAIAARFSTTVARLVAINQIANPDLILPGQVVVLDEVQRVPALLNEVHRAIESARRRFVLVGSSARRLKTAGTNLLAGRASVRMMYPLVSWELGADFDLSRVLRFGSIPLVWHAEDPVAALDAYVQLYVREEIKAEAIVRNLPAFLRFLPVAALFHGQVINTAGLARDSAAARTTRWLPSEERETRKIACAVSPRRSPRVPSCTSSSAIPCASRAAAVSASA